MARMPSCEYFDEVDTPTMEDAARAVADVGVLRYAGALSATLEAIPDNAPVFVWVGDAGDGEFRPLSHIASVTLPDGSPALVVYVVADGR